MDWYLSVSKISEDHWWSQNEIFIFLTDDANFAHAPQIEILNGQNVNQLYNEVWLTNTNAEVTGILTFSQVEFIKPIEIKVFDCIKVNTEVFKKKT